MSVLATQFWLVVLVTFVYIASYHLCYPFQTIYLHSRLGLSMTTLGVILGVSVLAGLPVQVLGGVAADRLGRRSVLLLGIYSSMLLFVGLAFTRIMWLVILLIAVEAALGWGMFTTANNAMLADLVALPRRSEAFGISRVAVNCGIVVGSLIGGVLLGIGLSYQALFVTGGALCALSLVLVLLCFTETKPASIAHTIGSPSMNRFRVVLCDHRFLTFCAVALLPLYGFGQFFVTLPVVLCSASGMPLVSWGLLAAASASAGVIFQYPLIRLTGNWNKLRIMATGSALIGLGLVGAVSATPGVAKAACVLVYSAGATLFVPISTAIVSEMGPPPARGCYMGVWTAVWLAGMSLAPMCGGFAIDRLGPRNAYVLVLAACLCGSVGFLLLQRKKPGRGGIL